VERSEAFYSHLIWMEASYEFYILYNSQEQDVSYWISPQRLSLQWHINEKPTSWLADSCKCKSKREIWKILFLPTIIFVSAKKKSTIAMYCVIRHASW